MLINLIFEGLKKSYMHMTVDQLIENGASLLCSRVVFISFARISLFYGKFLCLYDE